MTYTRPTPIPDPLVNLEATETNPAFNTQRAVRYKDGKPVNEPVTTTFRDWTLSRIVQAVKNALQLSSTGWISTTKESIQAKVGDKFQIDGSGDILVPDNPPDGGSITIIDPYKKLISQANGVVAAGKTIGKKQLPDQLLSFDLSLQNDIGVQRFEFIYSASEINWSVLIDNSSDLSSLVASSKLYIFTTTEDLKVTPFDLVGIEKPGRILLWDDPVKGQYLTITDDKDLLKSIDVDVIAPQGHTIGKGLFSDPTNEVSLGNDVGANWFRLLYRGDKEWGFTVVTKNG